MLAIESRYIYEAAGDLASGPWNSGPAYATESVTGNLPGRDSVP